MDYTATGASSISRDELNLSTPYEAPSGELETQIAAIFADVIGVERVGTNDLFFDLAGDSLLAETLATAISQHTSLNFEISWLVTHGSPRKVAELLKGKSGAASAQQSEKAVRGPIFVVPGRLGFALLNPAYYRTFTDPNALRVFELPGIRDGKSAHDRIEDIAAAYVVEVEREQPIGAVSLACFCHGALIGLEMARQLAEMGRSIGQLVFIDPGIPNATMRNHYRRAGPDRSKQGNAGGITNVRYELLRHLRFLILVGRWTDGSRDEDFADPRLRYWHEQFFKYQLWKRHLKNKSKYKNYKLSIRAQAKLHAAFRHYLPHRYEGPVTILGSEERRDMFEEEANIWAHLLPLRKVQVITKRHSDINNASAGEIAREMQRIFNGVGRDA